MVGEGVVLNTLPPLIPPSILVSPTFPWPRSLSLSSLPGVISVIPEQIRHPLTTRSPEFLGLNSLNGSRSALLSEYDFGSDLVVIDTGIFPDHRSFSDHDLPPIPTKWQGRCEAGTSFDPLKVCNSKLIGARFFSGGYEATSGRMNESAETQSPRDTDGHGTDAHRVDCGGEVDPASALGYARGVAAGMAPKARLAAYKVCWAVGCFDSDILAAFDAAVADGIDVISLSVGGVVVPYYLDAIAVGAFVAADSDSLI